MNIQTSNSVSVIAIELQSTLNTINQDVGELPMKIRDELIEAGICATGPMMFLYEGVTEDPTKVFDLSIAVPVSQHDAARYKGSLVTDRLEPFQYVETVMHGDLSELGPKAYEPLLGEIMSWKHPMTGYSREVYQNFVDFSDADNVTRVQIGVQAAA